MCLAQFAMWYKVKGSTTNDDFFPPNTDLQNPDTTVASENLHASHTNIQFNDTLNIPQSHVDANHYPAIADEQRDGNDSHNQPQKRSNDQNFEEIITLNGCGKMKRRQSPAVIRFHQCSQEKDPELYSYNRLLLFMPWRNEQQDLLANFGSYVEHYECKKDAVERTFSTLMKNEDIVKEAISQFQKSGLPRHAWDDIAPETEHTEADLIEEGYQSDENFAILHPDTHENASFLDPDQPSTTSCTSYIDLNTNLLSDEEYRTLVQSLNCDQRSVFQHILNWCTKQTTHATEVIDPQYIFVTGGAGTGKSHLITAIYNMVNRQVRQPGEDPGQTKILLMAPTGTAAFNINGSTVHSALQLPKTLNDIYRKLSDSVCNRLRVQLSHLKIIIIDEISMVSSSAFSYIDQRLQQIKDSTKPFGGVSVLAVGDLYQLRPIAKYIFEPPANVMQRLAGSLWLTLFHILELKQIMRQKDDEDFAALLNRVRVAHQTDEDINILQTRTVHTANQNYKRTALHIFATNKQTDEHNKRRLEELGQPIISLT
ncbi:uncharacterized protein LOC127866661 isoform X2 [Dreissena polymorpha]|uniref:uncharacterized protein LOC127866661 isoform X2 n=1 Tax=Dreissena polymorpha TaxID=45954 RepID=UPI00226513C2|nr:uncharacterized protein LOC127866661 isoform X2 [Dreissena polymorpha]